jgi:recombination endonuclease VII
VPYKDPEQKRAYNREYYRRNREALTAGKRAARAANPELHQQQDQEKYQRNKEQRLAYRRRYYAKNREQVLESQRMHYERNREQVLESQRGYYERNRERILTQNRHSYSPRNQRWQRMLYQHGLRPEDWARMWADQGGRCYLGGEELADFKSRFIHVDHDHTHCAPHTSCPVCRRGLTCHRCNTAIGLANDDPATLRRMADALEAAQRAVEERKAAAHVQGALFPGTERTA